jgi:hypothetical protein
VSRSFKPTGAAALDDGATLDFTVLKHLNGGLRQIPFRADQQCLIDHTKQDAGEAKKKMDCLRQRGVAKPAKSFIIPP